MAGTMRKMAVYLGLVEDDLDNVYDDMADDEPAPVRPREPQHVPSQPRVDVREPEPRVVDTRGEREPAADPRSYRPAAESRARTAPTFATRVPSAPAPVPVLPVPVAVAAAPAARDRQQVARASAPSAPEVQRITAQHPRSYNDARRIGEEYRQGIPVIINLTGMEDRDAKRIVDFAAGLVFGLHGSIERITNKVFLLSPANVDVGAEARAQIAQDGFFNQS